MGGIASRRNAGVEEVDISSNNAYKYPPRTGCYFGSHFIMGGERFETTQPEAYLFGDNQDLNFLGNRPIPFPYPAPQAQEPTKTLKSLVNIRKDSLRFVKVLSPDNHPEDTNHRYNIEFTFDTDVRVAITILYFATEEIVNGQAVYHPCDPSMNSEVYHYKRGANQTFNQTTHIIEPDKFSEEEWQYNPDKEIIPVVVQCVVEDETEFTYHAHMLFGIVEKTCDLGYVLKPLKQKQMVDGLCYLIQEIYGIENKNTQRAKDDDLEDNGSECVICMSDTRDTIILPCRHLCLCNGCADSLRFQANNCPICRAPFRALLQIRAMRKKVDIGLPASESEDNGLSQEGVPAGYEAVSLIEALNGPSVPTTPMIPFPVNSAPQPPPYGVPPTDGELLSKRKAQRPSSQRSVTSQRARQHQTIAEEEKSASNNTVPLDSGDAENFVDPDNQLEANKVVDVISLGAQGPENREKNKSEDTEIELVEEKCEIVNELKKEDLRSSSESLHAVSEAADCKEEIDTYSPPHADMLYPESQPLSASSSSVAGGEDCTVTGTEEDEEDPLCRRSQINSESGEGSPANTDSSGSSYSSTNSSKGLLEQPRSNEDPKC